MQSVVHYFEMKTDKALKMKVVRRQIKTTEHEASKNGGEISYFWGHMNEGYQGIFIRYTRLCSSIPALDLCNVKIKSIFVVCFQSNVVKKYAQIDESILFCYLWFENASIKFE